MSPALHRLSSEVVFIERGWLNANHLAFLGAGPLALVDSGYLEGLDETLALLTQAGAAPEMVDLIVTTHLHCDHVGGHAHIQERSGCQIALSAPCRRAVEQRDGWAAWWRYYGQAYRFFPTHRTLSDGDVVRLGGMGWRVLETPGHAGGHLCLFAPETGWLISADAVWDGDFGVLTPRIEGWEAPHRLRQSLMRLANLKVTMVLPGHGPPIADGPRAIARCLERVEAFIAEPRRLAEDQVRKILLYHLMMKGPLSAQELWRWEITLPWLRETCRMYFQGRTREVFERHLGELLDRGLLEEEQGRLHSRLPA